MVNEDGDNELNEGFGTTPCLVSTLGMFIIDQFRFEDKVTGEDLGDKGLGHQIGGGGTYFAIGARMWLPPSSVLMTVDRGSDFSAKEQEMMDIFALSNSDTKGYHSLWRYRNRREGTTRAVNIYRGEDRGFAYLTPKLRLDPKDLISDLFPTFPIFIHCICSPERARDICNQIDDRKNLWYNGIRPRIVWEPIPDSAVPENLKDCLEVMGRVDVISPNHEEAAGFLSVPKTQVNGKDARQSIQSLLMNDFLSKASSSRSNKIPVICIRSGASGALIAQSKEEAVWVEAYHTSNEADRVVDVTGAGNAWLGGFTAGLAKLHWDNPQREEAWPSWTIAELKEAAQMASVSASFVVEQQSLPTLRHNQDGLELWNNEEPQYRLKILQDRHKTEVM